MKQIVGIIGGMGPLATCDLMEKIIQYTDAKSDQEHIHICVDSNTEIPDRTKAILEHGKNPVPEMVKSALKLESMGANVLIMPCNTAHYFYNQLLSFVDVPILHMLKETAFTLKQLGVERVGVLATNGTRKSGIYEKILKEYGIETIYPSVEGQQLLMTMIYDYIKAGKTNLCELPVQKLLDEMYQKGAQKLILGCTELPVAFQSLGIKENTIDPTTVLAKAAIKAVGGRVKGRS